MSASAQTITGAWPPSSSTAGRRPASRASCVPTAVEPVNVKAFTTGDASRCLDTIGGSPKTRLTVPGGSPASSSVATIAAAVLGVSSEALSTTGQPAASAAPSLRAASTAGKFQAVNAATTPIGVATTSRRLAAARPSIRRPPIPPASSPFHASVSTARPSSPSASGRSLPDSIVRPWAISGARSASRAAPAFRTAPRSAAETRGQAEASATASASSRSPASASATRNAGSVVRGSMTSSAPAPPSRSSPPMRSRTSADIARPVDVDRRPRRVLGQPARQERDRVGDVLRLRDLAERDRLGGRRHAVLVEEVLVQRGVHPAGGDREPGDALAPVVARDRLGHRPHGRLGGRVVLVLGVVAAPGRPRSDVDDDPPAALAEGEDR